MLVIVPQISFLIAKLSLVDRPARKLPPPLLKLEIRRVRIV